MNTSRREFIAMHGARIVGGALIAEITVPEIVSAMARTVQVTEVSPNEDLMREHGLLNRVLLIYDDAAYTMKAGRDFPPDALNGAAVIIKEFIEDYHEKLEEDFLFKRFEKANSQTELVPVLRDQHDRGRKLTGFIIAHSNQPDLRDDSLKRDVIAHIDAFTRMYRPHESREDTILFPAFKKLVSPHEYDALGDDFENEEKKKFGNEGFESVLQRVESLEKQVGIYDLSRFTPTL
ncbi:MAG TPA: hemerythrin domain-containing protein [Bacteroidota bacterium]|nr:hemerythrin domain-containing protein [Bacteroidota bacterium]